MAWSKDSGGIFGFRNLGFPFRQNHSRSQKPSFGSFSANLIICRCGFEPRNSRYLNCDYCGARFKYPYTGNMGICSANSGAKKGKEGTRQFANHANMGNVRPFLVSGPLYLAAFPFCASSSLISSCYLPSLKATAYIFLPYLHLIELKKFLSSLKITALEAVGYSYRTRASRNIHLCPFSIIPEHLITLWPSVFKNQ